MYSIQKINDKQNTKLRKKNSRNLKNKNLCCWMKLDGVGPSSSTCTREWGGSTN
jgi:hypothetical protein